MQTRLYLCQNATTLPNSATFDRLSLKMLGSLNDIENLRASIINISADGQVDIGEQEEFKQILESLDLISNNAKALELWAKKNIKNI